MERKPKISATKEQVIAFMDEIFRKTGWRYFSVAAIQYHLNADPQKALNELRGKGIVRRCDGVHGPLAEYLKPQNNV